MMGLTKAEIAGRQAFIKKLVDEGCSAEATMEAYDATFGTHYSMKAKMEAKTE